MDFLSVAIGALSVSLLGLGVSRSSYNLSKENEEAQKENLFVRCGYPKGKLQLVSTKGSNPIDAIVLGWQVRITNNSLAPVNLESTHIDISMPNGHDLLGEPSYSDMKYGADHLLSDEGIYLAPGQSTSIGFDQVFPISPGAAEVPGVRNARTVFEANQLLRSAHFRTNLFEARTSNPDVSGALWADDEGPVVEFTVGTSHGKTFSYRCGI
jgi:hypothetical protein